MKSRCPEPPFIAPDFQARRSAGKVQATIGRRPVDLKKFLTLRAQKAVMSDAPIELTVVTMAFDATDAGAAESLAAVLSHYVVVTRGEPGCRNVDLCTSIAAADRFVIIQKWDSPAAQRAHFDGPAMVTMASACRGLLAQPPEIDLLEPISAHDLC